MPEIQRLSQNRVNKSIPLKPNQYEIYMGDKTVCDRSTPYNCTAILSKQEAAFNLSGIGYKLWEYFSCSAGGWTVIIDASKCQYWGLNEKDFDLAMQELIDFGYLRLIKANDKTHLVFIERPGFTGAGIYFI